MADFQGVGWAFPVGVDARGRIALARHERDIEEAIQMILLQLKASDSLPRAGEAFVFDLDIRDYNLWKRERLAVILVLLAVGIGLGCWVGRMSAGVERSSAARDE